MENQKIREAVHNAQTMLAFCAERGIEIPEEFVDVVVQSRTKLDEIHDLGALETKFWMVYSSIARSIQPVTIESLRTVALKENFLSRNSFQRLLGAKSIAHESVNAYRIFGLVALI